MSTEKGVVEKLENGVAWVRSQRKSACGSCTNKAHCSSIDGGRQMLVKVNNDLNAQKGDSVEFHLNSAFLLKCTFIIYMIPVLGLIMGAISAAPIANLVGMNHSFTLVLMTLSGFLGAVLLSRVLIHQQTDSERFLPTIKRVF
jgi:sigma-E factor negative regulatory protein RseC